MASLLYLSSSVPYPADSGERVLRQQHLRDLAAKHRVIGFFVDTEGGREEAMTHFRALGVETHYRPRPRASSGSGLRGLAAVARSALGSPLHWHAAMATCQAYRKEVAHLVATRKPEAIVVDHINAIGLLPRDLLGGRVPVLTVLHDDARRLYTDLARIGNGPARGIYALDAMKAGRLQDKIVQRATRPVCISAADREALAVRHGPNRVGLAQAILPPRGDRWIGDYGDVFFCGSPGFPPNRDAIGWLAGPFALAMRYAAPDVRIRIAGCPPERSPASRDAGNVDFLGFLPRADLERHYRGSGVFVCPIRYGSGVKIKLLEALSFGAPVAATREAADSVGFLTGHAEIDMSDPVGAARRIAAILADHRGRACMAEAGARDLASAVSRAQCARLNVADHVDAMVKEARPGA